MTDVMGHFDADALVGTPVPPLPPPLPAPVSTTDEPVIDLRQRAGNAAAPVAAGERLRSPRRSDRSAADRSTWRRWARRAVLMALCLAALVPIDLVAGRVIHDQRQRHLAHSVATGSLNIARGDALLVLQIPQIGVNQVVIEGSRSDQLRSGPGHVMGTAKPGDAGNIVIVGRRSRYQGPFGDLGQLAKGSEIFAQLRGSGAPRRYVVSEVLGEADDSVTLKPTDAEQLTLVTAGPGLWPSKKRVVIATPEEKPAAAAAGTKAAPSSTATAAAAPEKSSASTFRAARREFGATGSWLFSFGWLMLGGLLVAVAVFGRGRILANYSRSVVLFLGMPGVLLILLGISGLADAVLPAAL
jgi:LPXTG-site transpeptidase (sortase) family protein